MSAFRALPLLLLPLLLGSCSTSRLVDSDRVLDPGPHTIRSIIDSDILIPADSSLHVDYAAGNRFFVQSGGTLTGLSKGVQSSTIYGEEGALIPTRSKKSTLKIVNVSDAEQSFRDRFKTLLPANATPNRSSSGTGVVVGGAFYGGGYYGHGHRYHRARRQSSSSRSVSVKPDSYRTRTRN
ncbi:MAG: hypothetical protein ACSHYB_18025 [Roseibacillus sp.]